MTVQVLHRAVQPALQTAVPACALSVELPKGECYNEGVARRVLIADDSVSMRQLLVAACRHLGEVEVSEAADGLDAVKWLATGRFDLMFVDINMPLLDGLKLIRRVRQDRAHVGTQICVCTTEVELEAQARQLGADHFLGKPIDRQALERVLRACFPSDPDAVPPTAGPTGPPRS